SRDGRLALDVEQRRHAKSIGAWIALAFATLAAAAVLRSLELAAIAAGVGALVIPTAAIGTCNSGWPRRTMTIYTLLVASLVLAAAIAWIATRNEDYAIAGF